MHGAVTKSVFGFTPKKSKWRRLIPLVVLLGTARFSYCVEVESGVERVPEFAGLLVSPSLGSIFSLRWVDEHGATLQGWKRLGDRVANFELVLFDEKADVLTLSKLVLPDGRVQEELTEAEFAHLQQLLKRGTKPEEVPVLSRQKARLFWLRLIQAMAVPDNTGIEFDLTGQTLPAEQQVHFRETQALRKSRGSVLILVVINGSPGPNYVSVPRNFWRLPEPMPRNLLEVDWDELSVLNATAVARVDFSKKPPE